MPEVLEARDWVRGQESSTRPRQRPPTARYKARSAKTAAFSRKTMHRKEKREGVQERRPHSTERLRSATSGKEREDSIAHPTERLISTIQKRGNCSPRKCKREASRLRRAVAFDRSANDIAKQVTMTRKKRESHQNT